MTMSLLSARPILIIDFVSETKRSPSIVSSGIRKSCGMSGGVTGAMVAVCVPETSVWRSVDGDAMAGATEDLREAKPVALR